MSNISFLEFGKKIQAPYPKGQQPPSLPLLPPFLQIVFQRTEKKLKKCPLYPQSRGYILLPLTAIGIVETVSLVLIAIHYYFNSELHL